MLRKTNLISLTVASLIWTAVFAQPQALLTRKSSRVEILRTDDHRGFEPRWDGHMLLGLELNRTSTPIIWTMDENGRKEEVPFSIPEAGQLLVSNIAGSPDGTLVLGGSALSTDSRGWGFLGIISPDHAQKTIVRTAPFIPEAIAIAADGVIWSIGWRISDSERTYNVLARFDKSGKLLTQETMRVKVGQTGDVSHGSTLKASKNRVGWFTAKFEYLEFSLDGKEVRRFDGPPWKADFALWTTIALRDDGQVIASSEGPDRSMWILSHKNHSWTKLPLSDEAADRWAWVYGFDGDDLVLGVPGAGKAVTIVRYDVALLSSPK
jgi:hypothetical protein